MHRRTFIKDVSITGLALGAMPLFSSFAPGQKYRTALIGSGWWGTNIMQAAVQHGQVKMVGLCDVDERQIKRASEQLAKWTGDAPKIYKDYRELIQKEKPEIVIVATPDHWHPLIAIAALDAGAHAYVEKPISHTIDEGKAMVKAARRNGRMVQVGLHRRVSPHNISGMDFLRSGKAGKIGMVRAFVHYGGSAGVKTPDVQPPAGLDWNMWCGPAPLNNYNPTIHPKGFRQHLDYANGQLGDWGVHWMDQILWWTEEKHPRKIFSIADRHIKQDSTDAPDTQVVTYEFESFTAVWEHRLYAANEAEKHNLGCYFYGTEGTFHMGWQDGWHFYPADKNKPVLQQPAQLNKPDDQNIIELWANFISSIKTNQLPICDIERGYRATNMSLLGMLSHKLGHSVEWNGENIINDDAANKLLRRAYRGDWEYPV
jgi:predicted dehydrogenase